MKNATVKIILVTVGAVLFNCIFWQEKVALNAILFGAFILSSVFYLYPGAFTKPLMKWLLAANIITLAAVVIHNTFLSKLAFCSTLFLVIIFTQYLHRSVWYAAASVLSNYLMMIPSFINNMKLMKKSGLKLKGSGKLFRFLVIPLILTFVFFLMYNFANVVFQNLMNDIGIALQNFFALFFTWFSWQRFGFLLFGLFVTGGLLLKSEINNFSALDISKYNDLSRKKTDLAKWKQTHWFELLSLLMGRFANGIMALKNENITGIISLTLLNVLLLVINCIDIKYVWFGVEDKNNINLSQYVHEGAGLLIFSILIAMILLLFFFRGNLNFYKKNKWLRYGAYAWLFQNAILVISVLFRDYYYIASMGLAYKRIGVLVFLLLVLFGLITVFIKIRQRKTTYYLFRINAWFAIFILVVSSCIHWDEMIAEYNLSRKEVQLDVDFLLSLSDRTLPVLEKNVSVLEKALPADSISYDEHGSTSVINVRTILANRKMEFFQTQTSYSWLSWNVADAYVKKNLSTPPTTLSKN